VCKESQPKKRQRSRPGNSQQKKNT